MKTFPAVCLLVLGTAAFSQPSPRISVLLDRLQSYARDYRQHLPSFSCDESITSQWVQDGRVKREVRIEAVLREIRDESNPDDFSDRYEFKLVNGRPPKPRFKVPYFVQGAFANGIGFMAPREADACYDYQLAEEDTGATLRLDLAAKPEKIDPICKDVYEGYRKSVIVEKATGIIRHITRSMSAKAARQNREPFFVSIDYAPQKLGVETFWLPVRVEAHDSDGHRQMTATYSNFHRYTGELEILPGQVQAEPPGTP
jgi:hypothetical protein